MADTYHAAQTNFVEAPTDNDEPEATYDAGAWNLQIVSGGDDVLMLFPTADTKMRDHVLALLNSNPLPE